MFGKIEKYIDGNVAYVGIFARDEPLGRYNSKITSKTLRYCCNVEKNGRMSLRYRRTGSEEGVGSKGNCSYWGTVTSSPQRLTIDDVKSVAPWRLVVGKIIPKLC